MKKFILFLLKPGFYDNKEGPFFCPECATVEGFLKYVPELENQIDVRRVDFQKPRKEIVEMLGVSHQGCPVLLLDDIRDHTEAKISEETGKPYLAGGTQICDFLGRKFSVVRPHL